MYTTITLNKEMMKTKFEKVVTHFEREGMFGMGGAPNGDFKVMIIFSFKK